jgi:predicted Holliday junction resolvase-like endonuclease
MVVINAIMTIITIVVTSHHDELKQIQQNYQQRHHDIKHTLSKPLA